MSFTNDDPPRETRQLDTSQLRAQRRQEIAEFLSSDDGRALIAVIVADALTTDLRASQAAGASEPGRIAASDRNADRSAL